MQPRKLSLGMIGFFCIVAGAAANSIGPRPTTSEEMLGSGVATLLFWIVGITLIVIHMVRKRTK